MVVVVLSMVGVLSFASFFNSPSPPTVSSGSYCGDTVVVVAAVIVDYGAITIFHRYSGLLPTLTLTLTPSPSPTTYISLVVPSSLLVECF